MGKLAAQRFQAFALFQINFHYSHFTNAIHSIFSFEHINKSNPTIFFLLLKDPAGMILIRNEK